MRNPMVGPMNIPMNGGMNIKQFIQMMKNAPEIMNNPEKFVMEQLKNNKNPMLANLVDMANRGDKKSIQQFAQNIASSRGMNDDFNELMNFINR